MGGSRESTGRELLGRVLPRLKDVDVLDGTPLTKHTVELLRDLVDPRLECELRIAVPCPKSTLHPEPTLPLKSTMEVNHVP